MRKEIVFNSIHELVKYMEKETCYAFRNKILLSFDTSVYNKNFTGTNNLSEANNLLINGWNVGTELLLKELKNIKLNNDYKNKTIYDVAGYQVSVQRYLNNIPTSMIRSQRYKEPKTINILKNVSYGYRSTRAEIINDSINTLKVINRLEQDNYRVNLYTFFGSKDYNHELIFKTKIKSSTEPLNVSKISYPLIHPSYLRRHMLRCMEVTNDYPFTNNMIKLYGAPIKYKDVVNSIKEDEIFIDAHTSYENIIKQITNKVGT